jgi:6-phosphogluconolactonase (cycloisomerase 2 family)
MKFKVKVSKSIILGGLAVGVGLISGCAGESIGGPFAAEFVYVATGTGVAQYAVNTSGQLAPLSPAEVKTTPTTTNVVWVTVSKDAKFAYTADKAEGKISQFSVTTAGVLTPLVPPTVSSGTSTVCVEITPNSKFVYAINRTDNTISQFSVGTSGALTALTPGTVPIDTDGSSIVISPDGKYLYVSCYSSGKVDAFSIGADGQLTALTTPSYTVPSAIGATISPDGKYLYCPSGADTAQFSIGLDGSLTPMSPATVTGSGVGNSSFAVSANGKYGYLGVFNGGFPGSPVDQYGIGLTGGLTPLSPASVAAGNAPQWIVCEPAGNYVFVANSNDHTISQFLVGADGTLTAESPSFVTPSGALQMTIVAK